LPNAGTEGQQQQVYVADDEAAVEIPPPPPTRPVTTTESTTNNEIGTRTAQQTDRPTEMSAGDDIVQEIFLNDSAQPIGKEVIFII
jgi:hypothetical protein